ncbi:MAG: ABC transporter permease subunit [Akkermansiaceae bacterium]|nr:ABC transporter permease subunit [Akkermansiaceae bacterium]
MFTIFKRELKSYFTQPTAYAVICIFLFMSLFLTFTMGNFIQTGDANLEWSFFFWHPWIFMLLAPALGMRLWSDEQRSGTIELLGTFPTTIWSAILAKYLAASVVWAIALLLTYPMVIAVNTLGDPDNLTIFSGYIGSFLLCCTFLAITCLISAFTSDQVSCLIISCTICVLLVVIGFDHVVRAFAQSFSESTTDAIVSTAVLDHYQPLLRGAVRIQDLVYFFSIIIACLLSTSAILNAKRA